MPDGKKHIVVERDTATADADTLRKYYDSLADACRLLIARIEDLEKENKTALALRNQAEKNVLQQKEIVKNFLDQYREKEIALSDEIKILKARIKEQGAC